MLKLNLFRHFVRIHPDHSKIYTYTAGKTGLEYHTITSTKGLTHDASKEKPDPSLASSTNTHKSQENRNYNANSLTQVQQELNQYTVQNLTGGTTSTRLTHPCLTQIIDKFYPVPRRSNGHVDVERKKNIFSENHSSFATKLLQCQTPDMQTLLRCCEICKQYNLVDEKIILHIYGLLQAQAHQLPPSGICTVLGFLSTTGILATMGIQKIRERFFEIYQRLNVFQLARGLMYLMMIEKVHADQHTIRPMFRRLLQLLRQGSPNRTLLLDTSRALQVCGYREQKITTQVHDAALKLHRRGFLPMKDFYTIARALEQLGCGSEAMKHALLHHAMKTKGVIFF